MFHSPIKNLLNQNRQWSEAQRHLDPEFFSRLVKQQEPEYLWIGCADSRVPANEIVGLNPGELFVHRNVANIVSQTDLNCLSVLQYAVEVLKVKHILVVGHYGCGGVRAALKGLQLGLIDNWLRSVQEIAFQHKPLLDAIENEDRRVDRLCELNVIEQVVNVCRTTVLESAWQRGQDVSVNGWTYSLTNGMVRDLRISINHPSQIQQNRQSAIFDIQQNA